ncbi:hypothetical protein B5S28_g4667 [[Candida] boidinii]|nr:hypothetical protein B5S28_g4667 [[Candida] boidinii]OWB61587.1 hypothetical protein B5S29_g2483 [[Candida] boidinii]
MTESQNQIDSSAHELKIENKEKQILNEEIEENNEENFEENNITEIEHDESNESTQKISNSEDLKPYHHILKFYKYINHSTKSENNMSMSDQNSTIIDKEENNEDSENEIGNILQNPTLNSSDQLKQRRKRYWGSDRFSYRSKRSRIKNNELDLGNKENNETILEECSPNIKNELVSSDSESDSWSNSNENIDNEEAENKKNQNEDDNVFEFFSKPPVLSEEYAEIFELPKQEPSFFSFKNLLVFIHNTILSIIITLERTADSVDNISQTSPSTWISQTTGLFTGLFL